MTQIDQLIGDITNAAMYVTDSNNETQIIKYIQFVEEQLACIRFVKWGTTK